MNEKVKKEESDAWKQYEVAKYSLTQKVWFR